MSMKEFLEKLNVVSIIGFLIAVETQITNGSMSFAHTLPETWIPIVKEWAANLATIGGLMVGFGTFGRAPAGFTPQVPPAVKSAIILAVLLGASFAFAFDARAQVQFPKPRPLTGNVVKDIAAANDQTKSALTGQPAADPAAPLPCDFKMLIKLTPDNLVPTIKKCISDVNSTLVSDTQRALDSAKVYGGSGDGDAINCLTPALAIFKAGVQIPAVPAQDAIPATATAPAVPAAAAVPAQDPGPILLYQKFREFTLSGALTSCQSWFNGPINATAAAGLGAASTAIGAAAVLSPLK